MDITVRIFVMAVSGLIFFSVIYMLVKRQLNESNSILWLFIGFLTLLSGFFPDTINRLASYIGIDYPPTLLFLLSTIVLMIIIFKNSIDISKTDAKINEIAITVSIMSEEIKRLNEKLDDILDDYKYYDAGSEGL